MSLYVERQRQMVDFILSTVKVNLMRFPECIIVVSFHLKKMLKLNNSYQLGDKQLDI